MIMVDGGTIAAARTYLGWSQQELARKSGISLGTVRRMESLKGARTEKLAKVVDALQKAGIEFLDGGGFRPLRRPRR